MKNKTINSGLISNTASQVGFIDYTNSSCKYANISSYSKEMLQSLFIVPSLSKLNKVSVSAIEESRELSNMQVFDNIDDLFSELEN